MNIWTLKDFNKLAIYMGILIIYNETINHFLILIFINYVIIIEF